MYSKIIELLENKKIAILGFGVEGRSTYNFIRRHLPLKELTIIDVNDLSNDRLLKTDNYINIVFGSDYCNNLSNYDLIIKSPGISFKDIDTKPLDGKITSQLELLLMFFKNNVIGITGTKGKSTTTSLIYEVLRQQKDNIYLLGNIGIPIFDDIEKYNEDSILVVEMSSHQLEFIDISPHIGIILNLYEDHLDHAGSVLKYHNIKMNMFKFQDDNDIAIYCLDNLNLNKKMKENSYKSIKYGVSLKDKSDIYMSDNKVYYKDNLLYIDDGERILLGNHNLENIMIVAFISYLFKLDLKKTINTINSFKGLSNRLEYVGKFDDVIYYSDTIATIPEATISGINALKIVDTLILGGMDRGIHYNSLIDYLKDSQISNIICMPSTGKKIYDCLKDIKNTYYVDTLEEAVDLAKKYTEKNKICLLSPAAPSYEYFKNFEEKGNRYKELVSK